jgi:8-oxo-dGTP diphosphatase
MSRDTSHGTSAREAVAARDVRTRPGRADTLLLAAAIMVHDDRVLIVRRSKTERFLPSVWGVPCGKVDPGEEAHDAAVRELREETGLAGVVVRRLGQSVFHSTWRGEAVKNVQVNFLVRPVGVPGRIKLPKADQEAEWLSRDEIGRFEGLDPYNIEVLGQWLRMNGPRPASKTNQAGDSSAAIESSRL